MYRRRSTGPVNRLLLTHITGSRQLQEQSACRVASLQALLQPGDARETQTRHRRSEGAWLYDVLRQDMCCL